MSEPMFLLVMPGVFLAIAVIYSIMSAVGLLIGAVWRAARRRNLPS
jgi:hypothetical protein